MTEAADELLEHELFVSYAHRDNADGWVTALVDEIKRAHRAFGGRDLRVFFDLHDLTDMHDWELRILKGLRQSKVFLAVLSPSYFASFYCRKEWRVFLEHEVARSMLEGGGGVATVYYVTAPGFDAHPPDAEIADWAADFRARQFHGDLRPWHAEGPAALQREEVRGRLSDLVRAMDERIRRVDRAERSPSTVPPYNRNFVGRLEDLRRLRRTLEEKPVGAITAVQGIGGIGKTELAFTYAHAYADAYPGGRYLIGCAGIGDFRRALALLADDLGLGLSPAERADADLACRRVRARLGELGRCLLVLDNVDDPALLAPAALDLALPNRRAAHLLATTRLDPRQFHEVDCLALDALPTADAARLLERRRPFKDDAEFKAATRVVNLLGGHALACEVVGVYLQDTPEETYGDYLRRLETDILPSLHFAAEHEDDLTGDTYRVRLARHTEPLLRKLLAPTLAGLSAPGRHVIDHGALLAPDAIPLPWLRELTVAAFPDLLAAESAWDRLLARLTGLRLLTPTEDSRVARMHRVVQAVVTAAMPQPARAAAGAALLDRAMERAGAYEGCPVPQEQVWEAKVLGQLAGHWQDRGTRQTASLGGAAASALLSLGDSIGAHRLAVNAERVFRRLAKASHDDRGAQRDWSLSLERLGDLAAAEGRAGEARGLYQQGLEIRRALAQALPDSVWAQRDWSVSLGKLGDMALAEGRAAEAQAIFQQALEISQPQAEAFPDDVVAQRNWSVALEKLGEMALAEGRAGEARAMYQQALEIRERLAEALPDDVGAQRDLLGLLGRLGDLVRAEGRTAEARAMYQQLLEISGPLAQALPGDVRAQRDWSVSLSKLGDLAEAEGRAGEARAMYQQALEISQRLAQAVPEIVESQRDLAVSHYKVALICNAADEEAEMMTHIHLLHQTLRGMERSGMPLDPWCREMLRQLNAADS